MSSRDQILSRVKQNQPASAVLPDIALSGKSDAPLVDQFKAVLTSIGGEVMEIKNIEGVKSFLQSDAKAGQRIVTTLESLTSLAELISEDTAPHSLENVYRSILQAQFGVAENGALWLTESEMKVRALPFIGEHLTLLVNRIDIVPTMHEAYEKISSQVYDFGTFLAGPSKTADIEQSLVLGAHGSKSLTVLLLG